LLLGLDECGTGTIFFLKRRLGQSDLECQRRENSSIGRRSVDALPDQVSLLPHCKALQGLHLNEVTSVFKGSFQSHRLCLGDSMAPQLSFARTKQVFPC
jgi:hypothetical protein